MNQAPSIFSRPGVRTVSDATLSNLGLARHPRISIAGGAFTLIDAGGNKYQAPIKLVNNIPTLFVVIIGANPEKSKMYFGGETYDPDNPSPPVCWSDNGIGPSSQAQEPQAAKCGECPQNRWGSATSRLSGKPTKACADKKKLAVMVVGDHTGLAYEFQVPPVTLAHLSTYGNQVGSYSTPDGTRKADVSDFVTGIHFIPGKTGELAFSPIAWLDAVSSTGLGFDSQGQPIPSMDGGAWIAQAIDKAWNSGTVDQLVGNKDVPWNPSGAITARPQAQGGALQGGALQGGALQGGALQGGSAPHPPVGAAAPPYAPPPGAQAQQPQQAFPSAAQQNAPSGTEVRPGRGGARAGAGRKPAGTNVAPFQPLAVAGAHASAGAQHPEPEVIPPFLDRSRTAVPASGGAAPGNAQAPNFGMQTATPPPTGLSDALNAAFSLNTKGS